MEDKNKKKHKTKEEKIIEDDKISVKFIVFAIIALVIVIVGIVMCCDKKEKVDIKEDIIIPIQEEKEETNEVETIKTSVKKTSTVEQSSKIKSYVVKFYYNDNTNTYKLSVNSGNKTRPYVPQGYSSCSYYTDNSMSTEFNFDNTINSYTEIYMECNSNNYYIVYDGDVNNKEEYNVSYGVMNLLPYPDNTKIFNGWYTNTELTNKVNKIDSNIIKYADSTNTIYLYSDAKDKVNYVVYGNDGKVVDSLHDNTNNTVLTQSKDNTYCSSANHLGWTTSSGSMTIEYTFEENIVLTDNLTLYPVCGSTTITYTSEEEVVAMVGVKEEELDDYELPEPEDLGMETPTYFVPVEDETETSLVVVNDGEQTNDSEIEITEVINNAAEGYTPQVGDNVEEVEKEFAGWKIVDDSDPENIVQSPIEEDYTPPQDSDVTLNAQWEEPIEVETDVIIET